MILQTYTDCVPGGPASALALSSLCAQARDLSGLRSTLPLSQGASLSPSPTQECWPVLCRARPTPSPSRKGWGGAMTSATHSDGQRLWSRTYHNSRVCPSKHCASLSSSHLPSPRLPTGPSQDAPWKTLRSEACTQSSEGPFGRVLCLGKRPLAWPSQVDPIVWGQVLGLRAPMV